MNDEQTEILMALDAQKSRWEKLSFALKALCLFALTSAFFARGIAALDLRGIVFFPTIGFAVLDFFCVRKGAVYKVNYNRLKNSPENFIFDSSVKAWNIKCLLLSMAWYALLLVISFITAALFL